MNSLPMHTAHDIQNQLFQASANQQVCDWVLQIFLQYGISQIFGIPGAAIEPFYNALGRAKTANQQPFNIVTVKHETAAAFAAEGYFRYSGRPAICCSTAAPGITNLITGIASAKVERFPMVIITAQVSMKDFESGAPQDSSTHYLNAMQLLNEICSYSTLITHPNQLIHKLCLGLSMLNGASPGPIHFSFPMDIFKQTIKDLDFTLPTPYHLVHSIPQHHNQISTEQFQELASIIQANKSNITLYFGKDAGSSSIQFIRLATELNWSLVCSPDGKGLVDHSHPQFKGITGLAGHDYAADHIIKTNDLIILLGTTFDQSCNGGWNTGKLPYNRIIQINNTPTDIQGYVPARIRLSCDMNDLGNRLLEILSSEPESCTALTHHPAKKKPIYIRDYHWEMMHDDTHNLNCIKPQCFIKTLNELAGSTVPVCADCSSSFLWAIHLWHSEPKLRGATTNNFHITASFGSMGWAIGSSLGIAQAIKETCENTPSICITGDGSYLMSSQEIGTAAQQNLKLAIFVLNNRGYGMVKQCQKIVGAEQLGTDLPSVNFAQIAKAQGVNGYQIRNKSDLITAWLDFIHHQGPAIFDVYIDEEEIPPFGNRLKNLGFKPKT